MLLPCPSLEYQGLQSYKGSHSAKLIKCIALIRQLQPCLRCCLRFQGYLCRMSRNAYNSLLVAKQWMRRPSWLQV